MLFPAGILVVLILAAMSADLAHVEMARASLYDLSTTLANDLSTQALDRAHYRATGVYRLDEQGAVQTVLTRALAHRGDRTVTAIEVDGPPAIERDPDGTAKLRIHLRGHVEYIFAKVIPGAHDGMTITATAEITLEDE